MSVKKTKKQAPEPEQLVKTVPEPKVIPKVNKTDILEAAVRRARQVHDAERERISNALQEEKNRVAEKLTREFIDTDHEYTDVEAKSDACHVPDYSGEKDYKVDGGRWDVRAKVIRSVRYTDAGHKTNWGYVFEVRIETLQHEDFKKLEELSNQLYSHGVFSETECRKNLREAMSGRERKIQMLLTTISNVNKLDEFLAEAEDLHKRQRAPRLVESEHTAA